MSHTISHLEMILSGGTHANFLLICQFVGADALYGILYVLQRRMGRLIIDGELGSDYGPCCLKRLRKTAETLGIRRLQTRILGTPSRSSNYITASVAASGSNHQQPQTSEHCDINWSLQLILTKITNIEGAFSKMNERVKKLENDTATSKNKQIWPTP
jgi:hypothetical protein